MEAAPAPHQPGGLRDRPSRPHRSPRRTDPAGERQRAHAHIRRRLQRHPHHRTTRL